MNKFKRVFVATSPTPVFASVGYVFGVYYDKKHKSFHHIYSLEKWFYNLNVKFVRSVVGRIISSLLSVLGLQFLLSCDSSFLNEEHFETSTYGMPPNWGYVSGVMKGDTDGDGKTEPLPNVKIYCDSGNIERYYSGDGDKEILRTDTNGKFHIDLYKNGDYVFRFEDGDGAENGSFKSQTKTISYKEGDKLTDNDITLEKEQ